jgi:hypothetical protein
MLKFRLTWEKPKKSKSSGEEEEEEEEEEELVFPRPGADYVTPGKKKNYFY